LTSEVPTNSEVDVPETLVYPQSDARRRDVPQQALVRSWRDCGRDVAWVQLAGELDMASAPALEQALRDAELRARLVVLDLRELTFTDSCGVRVIVNASRRADRTGCRLVLVRGPSQADRMFALVAADLLEIVDLDPGEPVVQALLQIGQQRSTTHDRTPASTYIDVHRRQDSHLSDPEQSLTLSPRSFGVGHSSRAQARSA
jgi:anti-anti-sigma factor